MPMFYSMKIHVLIRKFSAVIKQLWDIQYACLGPQNFMAANLLFALMYESVQTHVDCNIDKILHFSFMNISFNL